MGTIMLRDEKNSYHDVGLVSVSHDVNATVDGSDIRRFPPGMYKTL